MKKLMIVLAALAMVASFLPKVYAEETASLNLRVTFAPPPEPLRIWSEPEGPFRVKEGETLEFNVIAEDKDTINVSLSAGTLPKGAEFIMDPIQPISAQRREGKFKWTPKYGQGPNPGVRTPFYNYPAVFNAQNYEGETVKLKIFIGVARGDRIISIELNEANWLLEGVKLGEKRGNLGADGKPIHIIKNTGNVSVMVDIGYGPLMNAIPEMPYPGLKQDFNTFITIIGDAVLPPDQRIKLNRAINAGMEEPLPLIYGAPTGVMEGVGAMSVQYEIRAFLCVGEASIVMVEGDYKVNPVPPDDSREVVRMPETTNGDGFERVEDIELY